MTRVTYDPACRICHAPRSAIWLWQPCGPSDRIDDAFACPGYHYRGFPAIPVCDTCRGKIKAGEPVTFTYKGRSFVTVPAENIIEEARP